MLAGFARSLHSVVAHFFALFASVLPPWRAYTVPLHGVSPPALRRDRGMSRVTLNWQWQYFPLFPVKWNQWRVSSSQELSIKVTISTSSWMVRDLWYNDALLGGQMVQVLILELLFLWQLTDTFKEQRNLLFPFNLAINNIFF